MEDFITVTDYSDLEQFQRNKELCWKAASAGREIDLDKLQPAEYKYFSELYWLYYKLANKEITQKEAEETERVNYAEYKRFMDDYIYYTDIVRTHRENTVKLKSLLADLNKSQDVQSAAIAAVKAVGILVGDESLPKRIGMKFGW